MTEVLTTCAQAIFRVKKVVFFSFLRVFEFSTDYHLTLKMASAQVVENSVNKDSPSQDSNHLNDLFQSRYVTPGFKQLD